MSPQSERGISQESGGRGITMRVVPARPALLDALGPLDGIKMVLFGGDRMSCCDEAVVVEKNGRLIGLATIAPYGEQVNPRSQGMPVGQPTIVGLYVVPAERRQGYGTELQVAVIQRCFDRGFDRVRVDSMSSHVMKMINNLPEEIRSRVDVYDQGDIMDSLERETQERQIDFARVVELPSAVRVLNCTPHEVIFRCGETDIVVLPSGATLRAIAREKVVVKQGEATIVQTVYEPTDQGLGELARIEGTNPGVLPIGSFISAQTYRGRVYSMMPATGFERVPVEQKRMDPYRFTVFPREENV